LSNKENDNGPDASGYLIAAVDDPGIADEKHAKYNGKHCCQVMSVKLSLQEEKGKQRCEENAGRP